MNPEDFTIDYITEILVWNDSANIPKDNDPKTVEEKLRHIAEEASELTDAASEEDQCDACVDLVWVIVGYMRARGWDVHRAFDAVSNSNFSKFFPIDEVDQAMAFAAEAGYNAPYTEAVGADFGVLKDASGKVKKPHTFYEPSHSLAVGKTDVQE